MQDGNSGIFTVKVLKTHTVYHPAFNATLYMMLNYAKNHEDDEKNIRKMVANTSVICYNLIDSESLLLAFPVKNRETVIIIECAFHKDFADKVQLLDVSNDLALVRMLEDDDVD